MPHTSGSRPTVLTQRLPPRHLRHEEGLLVLHVRGEALLLRAVHGRSDGLLLLRAVGFGLRAGDAGFAPRFAFEGFAELGVGLPLVVEVDGVCCGEGEGGLGCGRFCLGVVWVRRTYEAGHQCSYRGCYYGGGEWPGESGHGGL